MRCKAVAVAVLKQVVSYVLKLDLWNGFMPPGSDWAFTPRTKEKDMGATQTELLAGVTSALQHADADSGAVARKSFNCRH